MRRELLSWSFVLWRGKTNPMSLEKKSIAKSQNRNLDRLRASPKSLPGPKILAVKVSKTLIEKTIHTPNLTPNHRRHAPDVLDVPPENNYEPDFRPAPI